MRTLLVVCMLVTLPGCKYSKQEFSDTLSESATIVSAVHTPSRHTTEVGHTAFKSGGVGMDYGGNFGVSIGSGLQISDVTIPEKFAVVFRCQHGEFIIERPSIYQRYKNLIGDSVTVSYREVYRTIYKKHDDSTFVISRTLVDYDFLEAQ